MGIGKEEGLVARTLHLEDLGVPGPTEDVTRKEFALKKRVRGLEGVSRSQTPTSKRFLDK